MNIDLATQTPISAAAATKHFPSARQGKPCHVSRVVRAIVSGTPVPGGRVHLEALKMGGVWVTTIEAIEEYGRQVAAASIRGHSTTPAVSTVVISSQSARPSRAAVRAEQELARAGI